MPAGEGGLPSCAVCWQGFNASDRKPCDLGCGHSVCDTCLITSPSSFVSCPECRAPTLHPHINFSLLASLPPDPYVRPGGGGIQGQEGGGAGRPGQEGNARGAPGLQALISHLHAESRVSLDPGGMMRGAQRWMGALHERLSSNQHSHGPFLASPAATTAAATVVGGQRVGGRMAACIGLLPLGAQQVHRSFWSWAAPLLTVLYVLSPLDIIPDIFPIIGWMDDLFAIGALIVFMLQYSAPSISRPPASGTPNRGRGNS